MTILHENGNIQVIRRIKNGKMVCTKRCLFDKNGQIEPKFLREINCLKKLSNPPIDQINHEGRKYIPEVFGISVEFSQENEKYLCVDMTNADGNLLDLDKFCSIFKLKEIILISCSIALQYLHNLGYQHCDLSFRNILYINQPDQVIPKFILTDFGNSIYIDRPFTYTHPTLYTMSPELTEIGIVFNSFEANEINYDQFYQKIRNKWNPSNHRKIDIWSLGILSYILHTGNMNGDIHNVIQYHTDKDDLKEHLIDLSKFEKITINDKKVSENGILDMNDDMWNRTMLMLTHNPTYRPVIYFSAIQKSTINRPFEKNCEKTSDIFRRTIIDHDMDDYHYLEKIVPILGMNKKLLIKLLKSYKFINMIEIIDHMNKWCSEYNQNDFSNLFEHLARIIWVYVMLSYHTNHVINLEYIENEANLSKNIVIRIVEKITENIAICHDEL